MDELGASNHGQKQFSQRRGLLMSHCGGIHQAAAYVECFPALKSQSKDVPSGEEGQLLQAVAFQGSEVCWRFTSSHHCPLGPRSHKPGKQPATSYL